MIPEKIISPVPTECQVKLSQKEHMLCETIFSISIDKIWLVCYHRYIAGGDTHQKKTELYYTESQRIGEDTHDKKRKRSRRAG